MADLVEVLFYDKIGPYNKGTLHNIQDGVFLRALLKSGKGAVVNPPDWEVEKVDAAKAEPVVEEPVVVKAESEVSNGNTNTNQKIPAKVEAAIKSRTTERPREESSERVEASTSDSSEGYGGSSELLETSEEN